MGGEGVYPLTREEWDDLDDGWIVNVWQRPNLHKNDRDRGYWPVGRRDQEHRMLGGPMGPKALWYSTTGKNLQTLGFSQEEIDAKWAEWAKPAGYLHEEG